MLPGEGAKLLGKLHIKAAVISHKRVSKNSLLRFLRKFPSNCINHTTVCPFAYYNLLFIKNVVFFSCKIRPVVIKYLTYSYRILQFTVSKLANLMSGVFLCLKKRAKSEFRRAVQFPL